VSVETGTRLGTVTGPTVGGTTGNSDGMTVKTAGTMAGAGDDCAIPTGALVG
jgi:hypothetical protein